jgi:hypothetical protein
MDAASKVDVVAIANLSNGPGVEPNPDYAAIFTEADNHGVKLVGYVPTLYAARSPADVKNDIDAWVRLYPQISGFFFDQQPREARHVAYYAELRDYAKKTLRDPLVITNPGIACDEEYLAQAVSDVTCVFDNYEGFGAFELPAPLRGYDPLRFAALPYNVSGVEAMRAMIKDAIVKRIGYFYVSDGKAPNPWSKLPIYWDAEVDAVSGIH